MRNNKTRIRGLSRSGSLPHQRPLSVSKNIHIPRTIPKFSIAKSSQKTPIWLKVTRETASPIQFKLNRETSLRPKVAIAPIHNHLVMLPTWKCIPPVSNDFQDSTSRTRQESRRQQRSFDQACGLISVLTRRRQSMADESPSRLKSETPSPQRNYSYSQVEPNEIPEYTPPRFKMLVRPKSFQKLKRSRTSKSVAVLPIFRPVHPVESSLDLKVAKLEVNPKFLRVKTPEKYVIRIK